MLQIVDLERIKFERYKNKRRMSHTYAFYPIHIST